MSKPRIIGAFAKYTPNNRMDARFNRKGYARAKMLADSAIPKKERHDPKKSQFVG